MTARKSTALADRLAELGISAAELSAMIRRPVEDVQDYIDGTEPDPEAKVLLRIVTDPARTVAAELAAERVRAKKILPLTRGEDWQTRDVDRPYAGAYEGVDGGRPQ